MHEKQLNPLMTKQFSMAHSTDEKRKKIPNHDNETFWHKIQPKMMTLPLVNKDVLKFVRFFIIKSSKESPTKIEKIRHGSLS